MKQCMDSENLHRRLRKIIGQVQAIDRMIDEDVPCEDILSQINAAKSALHRQMPEHSGTKRRLKPCASPTTCGLTASHCANGQTRSPVQCSRWLHC